MFHYTTPVRQSFIIALDISQTVGKVCQMTKVAFGTLPHISELMLWETVRLCCCEWSCSSGLFFHSHIFFFSLYLSIVSLKILSTWLNLISPFTFYLHLMKTSALLCLFYRPSPVQLKDNFFLSHITDFSYFLKAQLMFLVFYIIVELLIWNHSY